MAAVVFLSHYQKGLSLRVMHFADVNIKVKFTYRYMNVFLWQNALLLGNTVWSLSDHTLGRNLHLLYVGHGRIPFFSHPFLWWPPLSYFLIQPVLHDWCNKCRGMYYPVCGMMYIKEPLLLIRKNSLCGSSGFPLSLFQWSFTICLTLYNRNYKMCWVRR